MSHAGDNFHMNPFLIWTKRIVLFLIVNILTILTISLILNILGVQPYLQSYGIDYGSLMAFCLIWGMGGSFVSLLLSKFLAKMMMGVQVIDPRTAEGRMAELVQTVHQLARSAGLTTMPEVGIYESPELNAFATGPTKSSALVAVSSGLLARMNRQELEGVLGHELSHVANGDMVTMTLVQGIVNAFVMFLSRVLAFAISAALRGDRDDNRDRGPGMSFYLIQFMLEMVFMVLGSIVVSWFSRWREFRADAGGARVAGRNEMIGALRALQRSYEGLDSDQPRAFASLKMSGRSGGFLALFASHPSLEERIARLESAT